MKSAECGVRNAECQGGVRSVVADAALPWRFRIPHSAFRILVIIFTIS
jgi:hypothetical protein